MSTTNTTIPPQVERALRAVRRRTIRVIVLRGALIAAVVLLVGMMLAMAADARLAPVGLGARAVLTLSVLAIVVAVATWYLLRPLARLPRGLAASARAADAASPHTGERLTTVASLAESRDTATLKGSPALIGQVTREADDAARTVRPEHVVPMSVLRQWAVSAAAGLAVLVLGLALWPRDVGVLMVRFWVPVAPLSLTTVTPVTGDQTIKRHAPLTIEAQLGGRVRDAATLITRDPRGVERQLKMERLVDDPARFSLPVPSVGESFDYRVRAGDGQSPWHAVTAVDPPAIAKLNVRVTPPAYARLPAEERDDLPADLQALQGSTVALTVTPAGDVDRVELRPVGGPSATQPAGGGAAATPLERQADGSFRYTGTLDREQAFEVVLTNAAGLRNDAPPRAALTPRADRPPTVTIKSPTDETAVPPGETVRVEYEARDDVRLEKLELVTTTRDAAGRERTRVTPLPLRPATRPADANPAATATAAAPATQPADDAPIRHASGTAEIDLDALGVNDGDELTFAVRATDAKQAAAQQAMASAKPADDAAGAAAAAAAAGQGGAPPGAPEADAGAPAGAAAAGGPPGEAGADAGPAGEQTASAAGQPTAAGADGAPAQPAGGAEAQAGGQAPAAGGQSTAAGDQAPAAPAGTAAVAADASQTPPAPAGAGGDATAAADAGENAAEPPQARAEAGTPGAGVPTTAPVASADNPTPPQQAKAAPATAPAVASAQRPAESAGPSTAPAAPRAADPATATAASRTLTVDDEAATPEGQRRASVQARIESAVKEFDQALAAAGADVEQLRADAEADKAWDDAAAQKLARAAAKLEEAGAAVDAARQRAAGSPYAFVAQQLDDARQRHVAPAGEDLGNAAAATAAGEAAERAEKLDDAAYHIDRARARLGPIGEQYARAKRETKLADDLARSARQHEQLAAQPAANPQAAQEPGQQQQQQQQQQERMDKAMGDLSRAMAEHPEMAKRMLAAAAEQDAPLREQLKEVAARQQRSAQQAARWANGDEAAKRAIEREAADDAAAEQKAIAAEAAKLDDRIASSPAAAGKPDPAAMADVREKSAAAARAAAAAARPAGERTDATRQQEREAVAATRALKESLEAAREQQPPGAAADALDERAEEAGALADRQAAAAGKREALAEEKFAEAQRFDQAATLGQTAKLAEKVSAAAAMAGGAPKPVRESARQLSDAMEKDVVPEQAAAAEALGQGDVPRAALAQSRAVAALDKAAAAFDRMNDAVRDEMAKRPPNEQEQSPQQDEQVRQMTRQERRAAEQMRQAGRPANVQAQLDWLMAGGLTGVGPGAGAGAGTGKGMGAGAAEGMGTAKPDPARAAQTASAVRRAGEQVRQQQQQAQARAEQAARPPSQQQQQADASSEARRTLRRPRTASPDSSSRQAARGAGAPADPTGAAAPVTPAPATGNRDWDTLASDLGKDLRQAAGTVPPEQYRRAVDGYMETIAKELEGAAPTTQGE